MFLKVPSAAPRQILLFLHGLCEHPARCYPLAEALAKAGTTVYLPEYKGHGIRALTEDYSWIQALYSSGKSSEEISAEIQDVVSVGSLKKNRSDFLRECRHLKMEDHLEELRNLYFELKKEYPQLPIVIGGFSLGGLLATALTRQLERKGEQIVRLLLISPAFMATGAPMVANNFVTQTIQEVGRQAVGLIHQLRSQKNPLIESTFKQFKKIGINVNTAAAADLATDLPEEQELFRKDPLVADRVPFAYLNEIQELMVEIEGSGELLEANTWMAYAEGDCIVNPEGCQRFGQLRQECKPGLIHIWCEENFKAHDFIRSSRFGKLREFFLEALTL